MTRDSDDNHLVGEHFRHDGRPKKRYVTKVSAEIDIIRDCMDRSQYAYRCGFCGFWHRATRRDEAA